MNDAFSGKIINGKYTFCKNNQMIGSIDFYLEHNQITITWLNIKDQPELRCKGYGSKMTRMFIEYVIKRMKNVNIIVLIPKMFDGHNRNWLCDFYEKNGFVQESKGYPFYIMKL
jgi:ribosomal protein S18 acetylase RimI-like enzyme